MQSIISGNQKSNVLQQEIKMGGLDVPEFKEMPSYPPLGIQLQKVKPYISLSGASPYGNSVEFKMPSGAGFLYDASFELIPSFASLDVSATENLEAPIAINMIREIAFICNGTQFIHKTKNALLSQLKSWQGEAYKTHSIKYGRALITTTEKPYSAGAITSFKTYLSTFESFLNEEEKQLLLNKVREVYVRITFDSSTAMGFTNAFSITGMDATMYCNTWMPELSAYQMMVEKDWSAPKKFSLTNCHEQVETISSLTTSGPIVLNCPYYSTKTHIFVRAIDGNAGTSSSLKGLPFANITKISMNLNGVKFLDDMPVSRLTHVGAKNGRSLLTNNGSAVSVDDDEMVTIDWSVLASRYRKTGGVFWQENRGSTIELTFDDVSVDFAGSVAGNFRAFVVNEYEEICEYQPSSGGGNIAVVAQD